jgi:4-amino-4-deoxy-L-arabinose transferase-like glycosyltransferase
LGQVLAVDRSRVATALVMMAALAYWLWFALNQRSIDGPDSLSVLAAQGIVEHGLQRFPSGFLYPRGYVPHYLLAGSFSAFGVNHFSLALPSLLLGLGTLWLVYLFARRILGSPWIGVAAAALLVALQVQTFYATGPRMYMALEFFTVLAAYSAWRGYIEGSARFQFVTVLALGAALLSNQEAALLLPAIPAAVLAVILVSCRPISRLFSPVTLLGAFLIAAVVYFVFLFPIPNVMPSVAYDDGRADERVGLALNVVAWGKHLVNLERALPYGLALVPVTFFAAFRAGVNRQLKTMSGILYEPVPKIINMI